VAYTRLGAYLFDWEPFSQASDRAKLFLLSCYIGPVAKQWLPGILYATVASLGESARMGSIDAHAAISELIEQGTLQHDIRKRVMRFTALPDKGERPANPKVLRMFWYRWKDLPESPLKYHHISLIKWLAEPNRTEKLQDMWNVTFATVAMPDTVSVDNSGQVPQPSLFTAEEDTVKDTVSDTVSDTIRVRVRYTEPVPETRGVPGGGANGKPAHMAENPFSVAELLDAVAELAGGRIAVDILDPRIGEDLWRLVAICGETDVTIEDVRLAGEFIGAGYLAYRSDLDAKWLAKSGSLLGAVSKARTWRDGGRPPMSDKRGPRRGDGVSARDLIERAERLEAEGQ